MELKKLSSDYIDLQKYCKSSNFDRKIFKIKHDEYSKKFSRLNSEEQGIVIQIIYFHYKWDFLLEEDMPKMSEKSKRNVISVLL